MRKRWQATLGAIGVVAVLYKLLDERDQHDIQEWVGQRVCDAFNWLYPYSSYEVSAAADASMNFGHQLDWREGRCFAISAAWSYDGWFWSSLHQTSNKKPTRSSLASTRLWWRMLPRQHSTDPQLSLPDTPALLGRLSGRVPRFYGRQSTDYSRSNLTRSSPLTL